MKIKLRDLTLKQYEKWQHQNCHVVSCNKCPFNNTPCSLSTRCALNDRCWIYHKKLYSDKFLNQEIEYNNGPILTEEEREYLSNVIKPFRDMVVWIKKIECGTNEQYIRIQLKTDILPLPYFENDKYYKDMEVDREYILEELGL